MNQKSRIGGIGLNLETMNPGKTYCQSGSDFLVFRLPD
jgi:hypothetical protein